VAVTARTVTATRGHPSELGCPRSWRQSPTGRP